MQLSLDTRDAIISALMKGECHADDPVKHHLPEELSEYYGAYLDLVPSVPVAARFISYVIDIANCSDDKEYFADHKRKLRGIIGPMESRYFANVIEGIELTEHTVPHLRYLVLYSRSAVLCGKVLQEMSFHGLQYDTGNEFIAKTRESDRLIAGGHLIRRKILRDQGSYKQYLKIDPTDWQLERMKAVKKRVLN